MHRQIFELCFNFLTSAVIHIILPAIIPSILFPLTIGFAAQNIYCGIIVTIVFIWILKYAEPICESYKLFRVYFFMWSLWSVVYLWILFKLTIPLEVHNTIEYRIYYWSLFAACVCFVIVSFFQSYFPKMSNFGYIFFCYQTFIIFTDTIFGCKTK